MMKFAAVRKVGAMMVVDILETAKRVSCATMNETKGENVLHEEGDTVEDVYRGPEASRPADDFANTCQDDRWEQVP